MFTLRIHHGGTFFEDKYSGGTVDFVDYCHVYKFTMLDLDHFSKLLGYEKVTEYKYFVEGAKGAKFLTLLLSEMDISILCEHGALIGLQMSFWFRSQIL